MAQISFELTTKPWFGPRKRAKSFLSTATIEPLPPDRALQEIAEILGPDAGSALQHVRFVDFVHKSDGFRYRLAICWTDSDCEARQALFDMAQVVVSRTGWYPLPLGSRLGSVAKSRSLPTGPTSSKLPSVDGMLASIEAAVKPEAGCAIRIGTTAGQSVLLDTGLPNRIEPERSDCLALITHAHADHSGGFTTGRLGDMVGVMTPGTARILIDGGWLDRSSVARGVVLESPGRFFRLGPQLSAKAFAVPHLPGSVGWVIRDDENAVVFTGDICVATDRHDFTPSLVDIVKRQGKRRVTLLLDATMAGRSVGASLSPASSRLVTETEGSVVVQASSGEHLLYAYLDLFREIQRSERRHSASFVMTSSARPLFEILHSAFIRRNTNELDPFLHAQYGESMSAWGESRWLYWSDDLRSVPKNRCFWFLTDSEVASGAGPERGAVVHVGRDDLGGAVGPGAGWERLPEFDTTPWTLHSNEDTIAKAADQLASAGARVVLFHNFSKRLRRFVASRNLSAEPLSGVIGLR